MAGFRVRSFMDPIGQSLPLNKAIRQLTFPSYPGLLNPTRAKTAPCGGAALAQLGVPAKMTTPVRDLSEAEARDIVRYLWDRGELTFTGEDLKGWSFPPLILPKKAADGTVTWNGQLSLKNVIAGVAFVNDNNTSADVIYGPGWRMVVLAYRLAVKITTDFGAPADGRATIFHKGFAGGGTVDSNRHNRGVALDFAGATTARGTFRVDRDWGQKAVPDALGGVKGKWPVTLSFTNARYRLDPRTDQAAHDFFRSVYNFAIGECRDGSTKDGATLANGLYPPGANGFVIHPDYGTPGRPGGRDAHADHVHTDVAEEFA
jgi:hypothetical protein